MKNQLNTLEKQVLNMLLAGDDVVLNTLREQLNESTVAQRQMTGAGFFTTMSVPPHVKPIEGRRSFSFGDLSGQIEGLERGAGFVLHVRDGIMDYLEGYSFDESWPEEVSEFHLSYTSGPNRNLAEIRREWTEK